MLRFVDVDAAVIAVSDRVVQNLGVAVFIGAAVLRSAIRRGCATAAERYAYPNARLGNVLGGADDDVVGDEAAFAGALHEDAV